MEQARVLAVALIATAAWVGCISTRVDDGTAGSGGSYPSVGGGGAGGSQSVYMPPRCGQTCQDYLVGLALDDTLWLLYNQNVAGTPAGANDRSATCPLGGTAHITGTTAVASNGVTTLHLSFDLASCSNSASFFSLAFTGSVSMEGTFESGANKFTAMTFSGASVQMSGSLKFLDDPAIGASCDVAETQQDSTSSQSLDGRVCEREFSSATALMSTTGSGSSGTGGSSGSGGGGGTLGVGSGGSGGGIVTGGPGCPSPYEGTYIGQFAYDWVTMGPMPTMGSSSFNLTATLACIAAASGTATLTVTHANASDPYFGCAVAGCTPLQGSVAALPSSPPTTPSSPSQSGQGFVILFPNGSSLATENGVGNLNVTSGGQTLSNALTGSTSTWSAVNANAASVFPNDGSRSAVSFKSWSLSKSAL